MPNVILPTPKITVAGNYKRNFISRNVNIANIGKVLLNNVLFKTVLD